MLAASRSRRAMRWDARAAGPSATTTDVRTLVRSPCRSPRARPRRPSRRWSGTLAFRSRRARIRTWWSRCADAAHGDGDGAHHVRHPVAAARPQTRRGLAVRRVGGSRGLERFIIEFFRAKDDRLSWATGLSIAQLIALGMIVVGFVVMRLRSQTGPGGRGFTRSLYAA